MSGNPLCANSLRQRVLIQDRVFDIRKFNEVALHNMVDVPQNSTSAGKVLEKLMF